MKCEVHNCSFRAARTLQVKADVAGPEFSTYLRVCRPHHLLAEVGIRSERTRWTLIPGIDDLAETEL